MEIDDGSGPSNLLRPSSKSLGNVDDGRGCEIVFVYYVFVKLGKEAVDRGRRDLKLTSVCVPPVFLVLFSSCLALV